MHPSRWAIERIEVGAPCESIVCEFYDFIDREYQWINK